MKRLLVWLIGLWASLVQLFRARRVKPFKTVQAEDLPDAPEPRTIYVAGHPPHLWAACMRCPCGCEDVIQLNLLSEASPSWEVEWHADGTVSLVPSVWRTKGCRSHFFVRRGRIEWCNAGVARSKMLSGGGAECRFLDPCHTTAFRSPRES